MRGETFETVGTIAKRLQMMRGATMGERSLIPAMPTAPAPVVTPEQLALVRSVIAPGATPEELQLFLYDCARQNVHPLDKLIHFTKRAGRYTPITSIDFMRQRAAETGEYAGNDDPIFTGAEKTASFAATATVYRLNGGQRYPYAATARWTEYKPAEDFMWQKMPCVMLGKCAEALALRKGFPKQLAGLYVKEEMDQATPAPVRAAVPAAPIEVVTPTPAAASGPPMPESWVPFAQPAEAFAGPPADRVRGRVAKVDHEEKTARQSGKVFIKTTVIFESGEAVTTLDRDLAARAAVAMVNRTLIEVTVKATRWGKDIVTLSEIPEREPGSDDEPF
jgi:phage recombination protein Bet